MNFKIEYLFLCLIPILIWSCADFDYSKKVESELAKKIEKNEMFLGVYLGMKSNEFFEYCAEKNKEGVFQDGLTGRTVQYELTGLKEESYILFYPEFKDGVIVEMPALFTYEKWAPWNKELFSNKLILEVRILLEEWLSEKFVLVRDKNNVPGFVNISGNRRITISIQDDQFVKVIFTDLTKMDNPFGPLVFKPN